MLCDNDAKDSFRQVLCFKAREDSVGAYAWLVAQFNWWHQDRVPRGTGPASRHMTGPQ
jgi:hypothetical protein